MTDKYAEFRRRTGQGRENVQTAKAKEARRRIAALQEKQRKKSRSKKTEAPKEELKTKSQTVETKSAAVTSAAGETATPVATPTPKETRGAKIVRESVGTGKERVITKTGESVGAVGKVKPGTVVEDEQGRRGVVDERGRVKYISKSRQRAIDATRSITRDNRQLDRVDTSDDSSPKTGKTFGEALETTKVGRGVSAARETVLSPVRGAGKVFLPVQVVQLSRDVKEEGSFKEGYKKFVKRNIKDKDIQAAAVTAGIVGAGVVAAGSSSVTVRAGGKIATDSALLSGFAFQAARTAKEPTPENIGVLGISAVPAAPAGAKLLRRAYVTTGSKYVPAEQFFSKENIQNPQKFPTTPSTEASLKAFRAADDVVQTSAPRPIKGPAGESRKSALDLEDPGIYVTPAGRGSSAFLGVQSGYSSEITLNPFAPVGRPTITQFTVTGVERYPRSVVSQPGFEPVRQFQVQQAGSGKAFITKRSEVGQGELPAQTFRNPKTGKVQREAGTTELEAVVPKDTKFVPTTRTTIGRLKGFDVYTKVGGEVVPVRRATVVTAGRSPGSVGTGRFRAKTVSATRVKAETSSLSRVGTSRVSVSAPALASGSISRPRSVSSRPRSTSSSRRPVSTISSTSPTSSVSIPSRSSSFTGASSPIRTPSSSVTSTPSRPRGGSSISSSISRPPTTPSTPRGGSSIIRPPTPIRTTTRPPGTPRITRQQDTNRFAVEVRERGVFVTKGFTGNIEKAFSKGFGSVRQTAAASFRVRDIRSGRTVTPRGLGTDFRLSKKEAGVVVQRRSKRIKSRGELSEITFKGVRSSRGRKNARRRPSRPL